MDTSWRSVLRAVLTVRETTRIAVLFSCLSILLGMIVDHSDRGLPWLLFFCTQGLLATVHVVAAAWLWWALPESLTRRRARLTCVLVGAVMGAVTMLSVAHITSWRRVSFSTTISIVAIVALSVLVAVAIIGIMWLGVYQGIGRDCGDSRLCTTAHRLSVGWTAFWTVTVALLLLDSFNWFPDHEHDIGLAVLAAFVILQVFYLRLVRASCRAIRACRPRDECVESP